MLRSEVYPHVSDILKRPAIDYFLQSMAGLFYAKASLPSPVRRILFRGRDNQNGGARYTVVDAKFS